MRPLSIKRVPAPLSMVRVPVKEVNEYPVNKHIQAMVAPLSKYDPETLIKSLTQREIDWLGSGTACEWGVLAEGGHTGYPLYQLKTARRGTLVFKRMRKGEHVKLSQERDALLHALSMQKVAADHGLAPAVRMVRALTDSSGVVVAMDKVPDGYRNLTLADVEDKKIEDSVQRAIKRLCELGIVHNDLETHNGTAFGNIFIHPATRNVMFVDFDQARAKKDDADCDSDALYKGGF